MTDQHPPSPPRRRGSSPTKTLDARLREHDEEKRGQGAATHKYFEASCYKRLQPTRTLQEFSDQIAAILRPMGFSAFSFAALTPAPGILFGNLPEELVQAYGKKNFIRDDHALDYGRTALTPLLRSVIDDHMAAAPMENHHMARNRELSRLFKSHGFHDFYLIPVQSGEPLFLLSLTTQGKDISDFHHNIRDHEKELGLLAKLVLKTASTKFHDLFEKMQHPPQIEFHLKPLQLIKTLGENDLTLDQTADRLCISIHTADKHIAAAKKALGAKTTAGAVYLALKHGVIKMK